MSFFCYWLFIKKSTVHVMTKEHWIPVSFFFTIKWQQFWNKMLIWTKGNLRHNGIRKKQIWQYRRFYYLLHLPETYEMFCRKPNLVNGHVAGECECGRNICLFFPVSKIWLISFAFGSFLSGDSDFCWAYSHNLCQFLFFAY